MIPDVILCGWLGLKHQLTISVAGGGGGKSVQKQTKLSRGKISKRNNEVYTQKSNQYLSVSVVHKLTCVSFILQHAHATCTGYFITQDSSFGNLILPVLPRYSDKWHRPAELCCCHLHVHLHFKTEILIHFYGSVGMRLMIRRNHLLCASPLPSSLI